MIHCVAECRRLFAAILLPMLVLAIFSGASPAAEGRLTPNQGGEGQTFSGEIVVGATFPITGPFDYYGQSAYYGAVACVRMINDNGGVNGKRLIVEWRDNQSDPALSVAQVEEFARDLKVPAIIGPLLSDSTFAVRGLAEKYKFVAISPMSTTDSLVQNSQWIFRATFNNTAQAEGLIRFQMRSFGAKSVGIIYDPRFGFSTELGAIFSQRFVQEGGAVLDSLPFMDSEGKKDWETSLRRLAEKKPDFIFAPLYALEAVELIRALKELDIDIRVCGADTWDNELVFDAGGRRLANTSFASALFEQSFNYRPFQTFFAAMEKAGMENPDAQAACAWDAVLMLAEALKTGETAEAVRRGVMGIKRLPLATGRLTILPNHESQKPVLIRVVEERHGRLIPVYADRYDPR